MTSLNRVILTGKVAIPPRRHYRPDGSPVIQFSLELNGSEDLTVRSPHREGTEKGGRNRIDIVAFGELADFKLEFLQRGQHLMVIGTLNQRRWQTPEGKNRTRTEVIATAFRTIEEKNETPMSKE